MLPYSVGKTAAIVDRLGCKNDQEVVALKRSVASLVVFCLLPLAATPARACSAAGCLDGGVEMRRDFTVRIRNADKAIEGASVEVIGPQGSNTSKKFTVNTDKNGVARVIRLMPGEYWLNAAYLEIGAAYHCFHVNERPSRKAKRSLSYDWGDAAVVTNRVAGSLQDSQPGGGGSPLWNLTHRVDVPIVGASLKLQNAATKIVVHSTSGANGAFAFEGIANGTYVLHIDAGEVGPDRGYEASHHLINVKSMAKRSSLVLKRREAGGGSCGGTSLELRGAS